MFNVTMPPTVLSSLIFPTLLPAHICTMPPANIARMNSVVLTLPSVEMTAAGRLTVILLVRAGLSRVIRCIFPGLFLPFSLLVRTLATANRALPLTFPVMLITTRLLGIKGWVPVVAECMNIDGIVNSRTLPLAYILLMSPANPTLVGTATLGRPGRIWAAERPLTLRLSVDYMAMLPLSIASTCVRVTF